ncbi:MAG: DUF934 domain-containing protein [Alphaproteobacteria bacterium]
MPVVKDGTIIEDPWVHVADGEDLPLETPVIVSADRWLSDRASLVHRNSATGVRLRNDQSPDDLGEDLHRFGVVALEFPAFKDGRAYTQARLLRERFRFAGEVRAYGDVLRDQLLFMQRCGIDAFEIRKQADAEAFARAVDEISVFYQPAADDRRPASALRHRAVASWAY